MWAIYLPWKSLRAAEAEQFECSLGAAAGGDVAVLLSPPRGRGDDGVSLCSVVTSFYFGSS